MYCFIYETQWVRLGNLLLLFRAVASISTFTASHDPIALCIWEFTASELRPKMCLEKDC